MDDRDPRKLSDVQQKAVLAALEEMSAKPSSQMRAGRILGYTQQRINTAVNTGTASYGMCERIIEYLYSKGVIDEPTVAGLLAVYGPDARQRWDWKALMAERDPLPARQTAKVWAFKNKLPVEVVGRVCKRPPYTSSTFAHRDVVWWTGEMQRVAKEPPPQKVPAQKIAAMVREDYEILRRAG